MLYLLAAIGAVTVAILTWKAFGPRRDAPPSRGIAPDDDPEFLRRLNEQTRKPHVDDD